MLISNGLIFSIFCNALICFKEIVMKTVVFFQLDLIRKANYPALHSHLEGLFGDKKQSFIEASFPFVNAYKQGQITQEELFIKFSDMAKLHDVLMDGESVKIMWETLHPAPEPLIKDIKAAIDYAKDYGSVVILSYNSRFATDNFKEVLQKHEIFISETEYGICINNLIEVHFSHKAVECTTAEQFFANKFQYLSRDYAICLGEPTRYIYLAMNLKQLPAVHQHDFSDRETLCLELCQKFRYDVSNDNHVPGRLSDYFSTMKPLVHELFEQKAIEFPNKLALSFEGVSLSYAELNTKSNQMAHYLRKIGVTSDKLVVVCLDRGINLIVSLLGILKAGGAYIPVDPRYPVSRLEAILTSSNDIVAIVGEDASFSKFNTKLQVFSKPIINLDQEWPTIDAESDKTPEKVTNSNNLVYVGFTSGSTGVPKGVLVEMHSLLNLIAWYKRTYSITPEDRVSLSSGVAFVVTTREIWSCLTAGASLHIVRAGMEFDLDGLLNFFRNEGVTITYLPTALVEILLQKSLEKIGNLTRVLTGGAKLKGCPSFKTPFKLYNHYGTTETSATVTQAEIVANETGKLAASIIGYPIDNQQLYVVDENMNEVPEGEIGELCVSGEGVSRGYLNDIELTAQRFVVSSFLSGRRLFKTGDRVRRLSSGIMEIIGRQDLQVKIRGMRVELEEVESILTNHEFVTQGIVMVKEDTQGNNKLVALLVHSKGITTGKEAQDFLENLRNYLDNQLPDYMVPAAFFLFEALPMNVNGKVDRLALKEWKLDLSEAIISLAGMSELPSTALEKQVAKLWEEHLGLSNIGRDHDFQTLGGNSLLVTTLREELVKKFDVPVAIEDITNVREFAQMIEQRRVGNLTRTNSIREDKLAIQFSETGKVIDDRYNIVYKLLTTQEVESVAQLLGETFADPSRGEPMTTRLGASTEEMIRLFLPYCQLGADQALSTIAVNAKNEVIGVSVVFDHATPEPKFPIELELKFAPIFQLLETADKFIPEGLLENNKPVIHRYLLGVRRHSPNNVPYLLHKFSNEIAKGRGYKMSVTEPTGPISQRIAMTYGYTLHPPVLYDEFEYEGKKPFINLYETYNKQGLSSGSLNKKIAFFGCHAATRPLSPPLVERYASSLRSGMSDAVFSDVLPGIKKI